MKIAPAMIRFEVSRVRVYPREVGKIFPAPSIDLLVEPPLDSLGLERLLRSHEIEFEDGKLTGFKVLTLFEEELIHEYWRIKEGSWEVEYVTPENFADV